MKNTKKKMSGSGYVRQFASTHQAEAALLEDISLQYDNK